MSSEREVAKRSLHHQRRGWRFRFSLRTLLLLVVVLSMGLAVGASLHGRLRQRTAAAMIQSVGALTWYQNGDELECGLPYPNQLDWLFHYQPVVKVVPVWTQRAGFQSMYAASRSEKVFDYLTRNPGRRDGVQNWAATTDEQISCLSQFPELRRLDLSCTAITDRGLVHLAPLARLETLNLAGLAISGEGLSHLQPGSLLVLDLSGTRIDDAAIEWLNRCTRLEQLTLGSAFNGGNAAQITDAELSKLRCPSLKHLDLSGTAITDAGLQLAHLPNLNTLDLADTAVAAVELRCPLLKSLDLQGTTATDAGLARLAKLPDLRTLNLASTAITDEGLRHLSALKQLRSLRLVSLNGATRPRTGPRLTKTNVSEEGVRQLRAALPGLRVMYGADRYSRKFLEPIN